MTYQQRRLAFSYELDGMDKRRAIKYASDIGVDLQDGLNVRQIRAEILEQVYPDSRS